jgi:glycosyltransferase involved in cell wall biosynthesis/polysaccharide pyruvyl transferase WcaK-like protein/tetratricopeptide (TPR) repeat protein/SAM-dependent methyltransferase/sulfatase maturation enzyme AslB (radical SAM superfamily)
MNLEQAEKTGSVVGSGSAPKTWRDTGVLATVGRQMPSSLANADPACCPSAAAVALMRHFELAAPPKLPTEHEAVLARYLQEYAKDLTVSIVGAQPKILNFQAVDYCNSRCCMCNVWKAPKTDYADVDELVQFLSDPLFEAVEHVGVTGGEPTLRKDLFELYCTFADTLPHLRGASFITNGFLSDRAIDYYSRIAAYYAPKRISFSGMVSLDGVGTLHDRIRGFPGGFDKAVTTLFGLREAGVNATACCTVVKGNVYGLHDLLAWARDNQVKIKFRVAEFINRLDNADRSDQIRNFNPQELRHLSAFIHWLVQDYETEPSQVEVYQNMLAMLVGRPRQIGCAYHNLQTVSIDSQLGYSLCSVKGRRHHLDGSIRESIAENQDEARDIRQRYCPSCIHDFPGPLQGVQRWLYEVAGDYSRLIYGGDHPMSMGEFAAASVPVDLTARRHLLLIGWYGTETAGDIAILGGIIHEYLQQNPSLEFTVLSSHPEYTRVSMGDLEFARTSRLRICSMEGFEAFQAIHTCDCVAVAGGPLMDLADTSKLLAICGRFKREGKPVLIEGCGIGPLNVEKYRDNVIALVQLADRVSVRSQGSAGLLKRLGVTKQITVRSDPSITYIDALNLQWCGNDSRTIRCYLRALTSEYPQATTREEADEALAGLLRRLLATYPDHTVELWPMHYFHVGNDDREYARQLAESVNNPRLSHQVQPQTPEAILKSMAEAAFCVCMRYHSVVFASTIGAPFLALDYTDGGKIAHLLTESGQSNRLFTFQSLSKLTSEALRTLFDPGSDHGRDTRGLPMVVQVSTSDVQGGAAKAAYSLYRALKSQGVQGSFLVHSQLTRDSTVVECALQSSQPTAPDIFYAEAIHAALLKTGPADSYFSWPILGCDISVNSAVLRADVLHLHWISHFQSLQSLEALARTGKPLVFTLHDQWLMTGGCHYSQGCEQYRSDCAACPLCTAEGQLLTQRVFRRKLEFVRTYKPTIVCPSRWMAERAKESAILRDCRIEVVPNCVELKEFKPLPKAEARHRLGAPVGGFYILFGASDCGDHRKGFDLLARALSLGLSDGEFAAAVGDGKVRLVCFGSLHPAVAESGFPVVVLGKLTNAEQLSVAYSCADLSVIPSRADNLPNTILESFSCGTPVIGANVGGIPELVLDGKTGLLFEPGNVVDLSTRILNAFKDQNNFAKLGAMCRQLVLHEYAPAIQAKRLSEIYWSLLSKSQRASEASAAAQTAQPTVSIASGSVREVTRQQSTDLEASDPAGLETGAVKSQRTSVVLSIDPDPAIHDRILLSALQHVLRNVMGKTSSHSLLMAERAGERFQLGSGFHQPEGDFHWIDNAAAIRIAKWALEMPMILAFDLQCGRREWYPEFPLNCAVHINGQLRATLAFEQDSERHHVRLPLESASDGCVVDLKSDQYFVPGQGGTSSDFRRLALQVRNVVLYADNARGGAASRLHFVSLDPNGMKTEPPEFTAAPRRAEQTPSCHSEKNIMQTPSNTHAPRKDRWPAFAPCEEVSLTAKRQLQTRAAPAGDHHTADLAGPRASSLKEAEDRYLVSDVGSYPVAPGRALEAAPQNPQMQVALEDIRIPPFRPLSPHEQGASLNFSAALPAAAPTQPASSMRPAPMAQAGSAESVAELLQAANTHYALGDLKACCLKLERALEFGADFAELRVTLGSVHFLLGQFEQARPQFERAVQLDSTNPVLFVQLASTCLRLQDADGFETALRQALALDAHCVEALTLLADLSLQTGKYEKAAKLYEDLLSLKPEDTTFLLALAKCCYHLDHPTAAILLYERVMTKEPSNAVAAEALRLIHAQRNGQSKSAILAPPESEHRGPVVQTPALSAKQAPSAPQVVPAAAAPSVAIQAPPGTPCLLARQIAVPNSRKTTTSSGRPVLQEESVRNQEEVNWWRNFIFEHFDSDQEVSERKFLERFQKECAERWGFICKELNLDINCCAEGTVLDVGNGPCGLLNFIPARIKVGVDPNNELYQRNGILYNVHNDVILIPARAEAIPLLNGSFDFITCVNVLDHTNEPETILAEVVRLLKSGGIFFLSVDTRKPEETQLVHPHAVSKEIVLEWAKPLVCIACRTDRPCYDGHPTNKRVDAWFQKQT